MNELKAQLLEELRLESDQAVRDIANMERILDAEMFIRASMKVGGGSGTAKSENAKRIDNLRKKKKTYELEKMWHDEMLRKYGGAR